jgi:RNA polymerase sigma-70 factor (ECF subfamily)
MDSEEALVRAAQAGSLEAFNELVLAYQGQLYALAYRMLGDQDAAADVTQEAFLSAYQHLSHYRGGSLRAWLLRIATNLCLDQIRRQRSLPVSPLEILLTRPDSPEFHRLEGEETDPEVHVERLELAQEIQRALLSLPPEQRAVIVLCDIEGLPYQEAAVAAGITSGTLKSRLSRARSRLRDYFLGRRELFPGFFRSIQKSDPNSHKDGPADTQ